VLAYWQKPLKETWKISRTNSFGKQSPTGKKTTRKGLTFITTNDREKSPTRGKMGGSTEPQGKDL